MSKIKIGISACLTGQEVRFDKSHKRSNFCMDEFSKFVTYQAFCPEMAVGLPTPRATVRQIKNEDIITVSRPDGTQDITEALKEYGQNVAEANAGMSGFIFCAKSPSCGMERVKQYAPDGRSLTSNGVGLFAQQIMENNPLLPCEENGRLNDALIRENFVTRVFVYHQWQQLEQAGLTKHDLYNFHASHKYLLMAHNPSVYKSLGRYLAETDAELEQLAQGYISGLMSGLQKKATRKTHTNTLQHLLGYFKRDLSPEQKQEMLEQIDGYHKGLLPLFAPLTLFKHYLREFPKPYLTGQSYFDPYPAELRLRYGY